VHPEDSTSQEITSASPYLCVGDNSFDISEERWNGACGHFKMETRYVSWRFEMFAIFRESFCGIVMLDYIHGSTHPENTGI
jgi:hypothetical protein